MARLARVVLTDIPHHVTQRGNGRQQTFFEPGDYGLYLDLLAAAAARAQAEIWSYCLMPNHVHIILTPSDEAGLSRTFGELHRRCCAGIVRDFFAAQNDMVSGTKSMDVKTMSDTHHVRFTAQVFK